MRPFKFKIFAVLAMAILLVTSCQKMTTDDVVIDTGIERTITLHDPGAPVAELQELTTLSDSAKIYLQQPSTVEFTTTLPITITGEQIFINDDVPDYTADVTDQPWNSAITKNEFNQLCYILDKQGWFEKTNVEKSAIYEVLIPDERGVLKRGRSEADAIVHSLKNDRVDGIGNMTRLRYRNKNYIGGSQATFAEVLTNIGTTTEYQNSLNYARSSGTNYINAFDATIAALVQNSSVPTDFDAALLDPSGAIYFSGCIFDNVWYPNSILVYYNGFWEQPVEDGVGSALYATCADEIFDSEGNPDINNLNTYMVQPYVFAYYNLFIYVNNIP